MSTHIIVFAFSVNNQSTIYFKYDIFFKYSTFRLDFLYCVVYSHVALMIIFKKKLFFVYFRSKVLYLPLHRDWCVKISSVTVFKLPPLTVSKNIHCDNY